MSSRLPELATTDTPSDAPFAHPAALLSVTQRQWLTPPNPFLRVVARPVMYALNWIGMRVLFRLRVEGSTRVPPDGPYILAPNHTSFLDPFVLAASFNYRWFERLYWAAAAEVIRRGWLTRLVCRVARAVPIEAKQPRGANVALGATILRAGNSLVWFPEGQRSPTRTLQPFHSGVGLLAAHFQPTIVPIFIRGAAEALPVGRRCMRFRPITVRVGTPLSSQELEQRGQGASPHECILWSLHRELEALEQTTKR